MSARASTRDVLLHFYISEERREKSFIYQDLDLVPGRAPNSARTRVAAKRCSLRARSSSLHGATPAPDTAPSRLGAPRSNDPRGGQNRDAFTVGWGSTHGPCLRRAIDLATRRL